MADPFVPCLAFALNEEGMWSNDPLDPGGPTYKGLTMRDIRRWFPNATVDDLHNAPNDLVAAMYRSFYWDEVRAADLWPGLNLLVFDYGVNAGAGTSVRSLQSLLHTAAVDGVAGPLTIAAASGLAPPHRPSFLAQLAEAHRVSYRAMWQFPRYGKGWIGRVDRGLAVALKMLPQQT